MKTLVHNQTQLLEALDSIQGTSLLVIGDLIIDRYVWGSVERISQEAPVPVLDVGRREDRLGGAANVARNLRALGLSVELAGVVGDDLDAEVLRALCKKDSIGIETVLTDVTRPTTVKTRIMAGKQQVVRIDSEKRVRLSGTLEEDFVTKIISKISTTSGVVVSDYGKGVLSGKVLDAIAACQRSRQLAVSTKPLIVDPNPASYPLYRSVGVIKPNRKEAEQAAQREIHSLEDAIDAAKIISQKWQAEIVIITLGEGGMLLYDVAQHSSTHFPTLAQDVFDVSGAGDSVTALLAAGLASKISPACVCELANIAARVAVSQVGTVAVAKERIRQEIMSIA